MDLNQAIAVILSTQLPPGADPLLVERRNVAKALIEALATVGYDQAALAKAKTDTERAAFEGVIADKTAECHRLGDRLLQIAAALQPPNTRQ